MNPFFRGLRYGLIISIPAWALIIWIAIHG